MNTFKHLLVWLIIATLPFWLIWSAYYMSGRIFAPETVFFSNGWWSFVIFYTIAIVIIAPAVYIHENESKK